MVKIKYDVSETDGERTASEENLDLQEAPKGLYIAELHDLEASHAKGDDGEPDKDRPMLVAHWELIADGDGGELPARYWRVRDYYSQSKSAQWKMDQLLQALGVAKPKTKRKGTLDTDKVKGTLCLVRIRTEMFEGEDRAKVARVSPYEGVDPRSEGSDLSDDDLEEDEFEEEEDLDEEDLEDEEAWPDEDEVRGMTGAELKELISEMREEGIEIEIPKGAKVKKVKDLVVEALAEHVDAEGSDEDEDEDEDEVPF